MEAYIDELAIKWTRLKALEGLNEEQVAEYAEEKEALKTYFLQQAAGDGGAKDRFSPFLDLANWK